MKNENANIVINCIQNVENGCYDAMSFKKITKILDSVEEKGNFPEKKGISSEKFFNSQFPKLLSTIIDTEVLNDDLKEAMQKILISAFSIFNKHFSTLSIEYIDEIKLICTENNSKYFRTVPLQFNLLISNINSDKIEEYLLNSMENDIDESLLHKISSLICILSTIGEKKDSKLGEKALSFVNELSQRGTNENKYLYEILTSLLSIEENSEQIEELFLNLLEKEQNMEYFFKYFGTTAKYNECTYRKAVDNCSEKYFLNVSKTLVNANDEIVQDFWNKLNESNSLQSFYPLVATKKDIFIKNISADIFSYENIDFFLISLEKVGEEEKIIDFLPEIYNFCTKKYQFSFLETICGQKYIDNVLKSPLHIVEQIGFKELLKCINNSSEEKNEVDFSSVLKYASCDDIKEITTVIKKLDNDSLYKLEDAILMMPSTEELIDLYSVIFKITFSDDKVWTSLLNNGGTAIEFYVRKHGQSIIDKCFDNIDKLGAIKALTALAKNIKCAKNKFDPTNNDKMDEKPNISEKQAETLFTKLSHPNGDAILELLNEIPTVKSEIEKLSPAIELETNWYKILSFESINNFIYRINALGNMITHPNGKWLKVFDLTGGTDALVNIALMVAQNIDDKNVVEFTFSVAIEVVKRFPSIVSKIYPEKFLIAANPELEIGTLLFAEAVRNNSLIINDIKDLPHFLHRLVFGSEKLIEAAKIIVSVVNTPVIQDILISFAEEAFKKNVVAYPNIAAIAIKEANEKNKISDCIIDNFIKLFMFPSDPYERLNFQSPSKEFFDALLSALTVIFSNVEKNVKVNQVFSVLINDILLNGFIYYKPTNNFEDLAMNILDRFGELSSTVYSSLLKISKTKYAKYFELDPFVPTKTANKKFSKENNSLRLARKIFNNNNARNMVITSIFEENTWQYELQNIFIQLLYVPTSVIKTDKFIELFGDISLQESLEKYATLPFLSFDDYKYNNIVAFEGRTILFVKENMEELNMHNISKKVLFTTIDHISSSIYYNIRWDNVFYALLSRVKEEKSNPHFSVDRILSLYEKSPDPARLRSISINCCLVCRSNQDTALYIVRLKNHHEYILNDNPAIRNSYANILCSAFSVTKSEILSNSLMNLIDENLCKKWQSIDCLFSVLSKTMFIGKTDEICEKTMNFILKDLRKYINKHHDENIMSNIDLSGALLILSHNPKLYGDRFKSLYFFNEMFMSMKHQAQFVQFLSTALFDDKNLQDKFLEPITNNYNIAGHVCAKYFIISIAWEDNYTKNRIDKIINFLRSKSVDYQCAFFDEIINNISKDSNVINKGFFNRIDKWIEVWLLSPYPKIRSHFIEVTLSFIKAMKNTKTIAIQNTYDALLKAMDVIKSHDLKVIKSYSSYTEQGYNFREILPEKDFFSFFKTIIDVGQLTDKFIEAADYIGRMIGEFTKLDSEIEFPKMHLLLFINKVVPRAKGPTFYRGMNYQKMLSSFDKFVFDDHNLLIPLTKIIKGILARTPPELIPMFLASKVFKKTLKNIFNAEYGVGKDVSDLLIKNISNFDKSKFADDFLHKSVFKRNLEQNNVEYFVVCCQFIKSYPKALEKHYDEIVNIIWDNIRYVVIYFGKISDVYSIPNHISNEVLAQLAMLAGICIDSYKVAFKGKKDFLGKSYIKTMKEFWKSKELDPMFMLKVATNPKEDVKDTTGYFVLIEALSKIDKEFAEDVAEVIKGDLISRCKDKLTKCNAANFISNFTYAALTNGYVSKKKLLAMNIKEFCNSNLEDGICESLSRIIDEETMPQAEEHIKNSLETCTLETFSKGLLALCTKLDSNNHLGIKDEIVEVAKLVVDKKLKKLCESFAPSKAVQIVSCLMDGVCFVHLLSKGKTQLNKSEILSINVKVKQTGNIKAIELMNSIINLICY